MSENDLRQTRAGKNQALFREVNERLLELNDTRGSRVQTTAFVCECARVECTVGIELTLQEYERIRRDPHRFFVAPSIDHYFADVERIVETYEEYYVVEKVGIAAAVAEQAAAR